MRYSAYAVALATASTVVAPAQCFITDRQSAVLGSLRHVDNNEYAPTPH
eukprot:CAMPEP_0183309896 /NCGR_PEP_ID=MMETSP0160_2-20130417/26650_1 /TAXON_ID=2839 ORGANISM="Odontella Sinensis, Strain Grunow 1884" /NCGR_SAMPLE_ID=MMETSP0160_2 /ASSEMBLY_ACC=CAM_ASM_000250 /LENGTH=48 /DNA_ID= /DNA_START= /DNA_END= /DNA_ORIENTATION=